MANVCENWVKVMGNAEDTKSFCDLVGKEFDFNKIIPLEDSKSSKEARDKWGCGSIAFEPVFEEEDDGTIKWEFWTKWNPPFRLYEELCEKFPNVYIYWRYEEPGCGLYGYLNDQE